MAGGACNHIYVGAYYYRSVCYLGVLREPGLADRQTDRHGRGSGPRHVGSWRKPLVAATEAYLGTRKDRSRRQQQPKQADKTKAACISRGACIDDGKRA